MNPQIDKMFSEAEGRYLEPVEQAALIEFANSLDLRLAAMREIQEKEAAIIAACVRLRASSLRHNVLTCSLIVTS